MNSFEERFLIYTALIAVCTTAAVFVGWQAAAWTLAQMAGVVEFIYWLGTPATDNTRHNSKYCA